MVRYPITAIALALSCVFSSAASGHEFWIDPVPQKVAAGDSFEADLRVGEFMRGSVQVYNANRIKQAGIVAGDAIARIDGRLGDRPAIQLSEMRDGLNVIGVETNASTLSYPEFAKFERFARNHGNAGALDLILAKGLKTTGILEAYFRFAKALVPVGDGEGQDRQLGFAYELTAVNNPFTGDGPVRFLLTFNKTPVPSHQVDMLHRPIGSIENAELVKLSTDAQGIVSIPRKPGEFLINAVHLEEPNEKLRSATGADWVSLWASTTYSLDK